ncbi:MAG: bacterial Ig-like domain-containing protein, partial [Clostridia bacterium]|nr:bacterial Ig-like domain-containing protein [Clostridia bacterium]
MKICNRLLSLVLAVLMLVPLSILPAVAANDDEEFVDTNFSFEIESVTYTETDNPAAGDTISLEVCVQNLTDEDDLGSIELRLNYDDTKLEFVAAREKTGSGKNAVTHMGGYFGLFQSAAPATNPAKNYIVNVSFENQKWDSEWDINNDIFMMVDFKVLGDWGGSTEIQLDGQAQRRADALFYRGENDTRDITWGKGTVTRPGAAAEPELESIAVTTLPTKTEYLESAPGEFDPAGGKLTLTYDDESTEEIDLSEAVVTGFDDTQVGPQTLTVTYEGKTCTFDVTVVAKSITGISVDRLPAKLTYLEGDELDLTGGQIEVAYNNDTYDYQRMLNVTVTGYDKNAVGPQTLTVTYEGFTCTFEVDVIAKEITSIMTLTPPTKALYLEGKDALDLAGGTFRVFYNNNTSDDLPMTEADVTGFDNTVPGDCVVTVTYQGFTTQFSVYIMEKAIDHIVVTKNPDKTTYFLGESLDLTGGELTVYYNNDTSDVIALSEVVVTGFDSASAGTQTLTAEYQQHTAGFEVTVMEKEVTGIEVTTLPNKLVYKENKPGER